MVEVSVSKYDFSNIVEDPTKRLVLVIYDMIDNKRRLKMVKLLEGYGIRVQKSAFEALITERKYQEMVARIERIAEEEDNVRIYRLNSSNEVVVLGDSVDIADEEVIVI